MRIQNMFQDDINRKINGVIKVNQDDLDIIRQEVQEYVITRELRKHFLTFFNYYCEMFDSPNADIGAWLSGFFGSGKSHLLKMLSYILENKEIDGTTVVEMFREKFADDPATFMLIDRATREQAETILFNIDIEGSINKDKTAVLRVFAKMFYNHLGFYGENLKVAQMEYYIDQCGKTADFRRVFEEKRGMSWVQARKAFSFNGKYIVPTLMEVLDMTEKDADAWFRDKSAVEMSIALLADEIRAYVEQKPKDFRLLFMIDEVGQYIGTDLDMLINMQSLVEEIGRTCNGKVWVMCTGQEALDEIIKVRQNEFSRIMARFKVHLSLTSSSADEVIQKRLLKKTENATHLLEGIYTQSDSILRNLFTFKEAMLDIKGYTGPQEFAVNFPFVPYQFLLIQKIFSEIRKHGNAGKHYSGAERSMLDGFQIAAKKIQAGDEYNLAPLYSFYDSIHEFLDGSIRRVIERCANAAATGAGLEALDVDVLKLLYLIRYVPQDMPANLDNLVILMADNINIDPISMRKTVAESLNRLFSQNYIGRTGDTYHFLTDEEQDIRKDIIATNVDTASIVERIAHMIFADIYPTKKYQYGKYNFSFDQMVDGVTVGAITGGMRLKVLTVATDATEKAEMRLMTDSVKQAVVVLGETPYYESLEWAMKIRKYVKQRNVSQLSKSVQDIISRYTDEAKQLEEEALNHLRLAIAQAEYYVDGEHLTLKGNDAKAKIDQALEYLVVHVYSQLELITKNAESDEDILTILTGMEPRDILGGVPNQDAAAKVEKYLEIQAAKNLPTSMFDVQTKYQGVPYGWREIDVAAVVARLICDQKVTIKQAGTTIRADNPKLPDMLRKKSEIGKTTITIKVVVGQREMKAAREFLRQYFEVMTLPEDEDGLILWIINQFSTLKAHYEELKKGYEGNHYPDYQLVVKGIDLIDNLLSQQKDNIALIQRLLKLQDDFIDHKQKMARVEEFFSTQRPIFDDAYQLTQSLSHELDYLMKESSANEALNQIRLVTMIPTNAPFDYTKIKKLPSLIADVHEGHDRLLASKREELLEIVRQCMEAIHMAAADKSEVKAIVQTADQFYTQKKQQIAQLKSLALLDGLVPPMIQYKDQTVTRIERAVKPVPPKPPVEPVNPPQKKVVKQLNRMVLFPQKTLESTEDVDAYLAQIKKTLVTMMQGCDGIKLN